MDSAVVAALVRHALTAVAGGFAVKYGVDGTTIDIIAGGAAAAAGVGWSLFDKRRKKF
jgi:phage shock protein PspC (stress-responsive transcriptional regulator)